MGKYNKQAPGDTPGYVYLLHCENGLYKVGRSAWPETRVTELRHQNGIRGTLLWKLQCADMVTTERALHQRLAQYHANRELFDLPAVVVEWLCQQTEASACEGYDPSQFKRTDARGYRVGR